MKSKSKKGVMSEVVGIFVLVLVIAVLAGMTFLFTGTLKSQSSSLATDRSPTITVLNETITSISNVSANLFGAYTLRDSTCTLINITNSTGGAAVPVTNYTLTNCNFITLGYSGYTGRNVNASYTYTWRPYTSGEVAINGTESSGATVVSYLPILFLALIFGAILAIVLRIILPYINLGRSSEGF